MYQEIVRERVLATLVNGGELGRENCHILLFALTYLHDVIKYYGVEMLTVK